MILLLSPPLDPGETNTSEAVPSFHDVMQKGGLPRVRERARALIIMSAYVYIFVYSYIRVYICICMRANDRARASHVQNTGMRELMWMSSGMYRRMLRQRMRNEVRAFASHRVVYDRRREGRVFIPAMHVCGQHPRAGDETPHPHLGDF